MQTIYIFGAFGQDGTLTKKLLRSSYKNLTFLLFGSGKVIIEEKDRQKTIPINSQNHYLDLVKELIDNYNPNIIFYFAAVHFSSFEKIKISDQINMAFSNYLLPVHLYSSIKNLKIKPKFFYASSSLIFGGTTSNIQNEKTERSPICAYSRQKEYAGSLISHLAENFEIDTIIGILYNHESVYRKEKFFTKKVLSYCSDFHKNSLNNKQLEIFNPDAIVDMGYAPEFIYCILKLILSGFSGTYIFSTGNGISIDQFVNSVFCFYNLDTSYVDYKYAEARYKSSLIGDNSKLKEKISYKPIFFKKKLAEKLCSDFEKYKKKDLNLFDWI